MVVSAAMIRQLHIQNFRCLRDVKLDLEPLTVFVGANASGKSSVFAALNKARNLQFLPTDRWARDGNVEVRIATASDSDLSSLTVFAPHGAAPPVNPVPSCQVLQLDLTQLRQGNQVTQQHQLADSGYGLANVFYSLTRAKQQEVSDQFCNLVPLFAEVEAKSNQPGHHRIVLQDRWHSSVWYEPNDVSDGSMLTLAFLLLPYQTPAPDVIAIEEPERGIHPYLLHQLVDTLRKLALGQLGPQPVQILLATHSPQLLECVEPREVRFFRRALQTGETIVESAPVDSPRWLDTLKVYDNRLGDIWMSGGLGGVTGK